MEINNWPDFVLYLLFTLGVIFILVPLGINFTYTGIMCVRKYGFKKFPEGSNVSKVAKTPQGLIALGVFAMLSSIWYLFIDSGGNLLNLISETREFFSN